MLSHHILLTLDAPPLSPLDASQGLLLIDGTWRLAAVMERQVLAVGAHFIPRSIPRGYVTAYPRRQLDCSEPGRGLASVEALYIAYRLLGRDPSGLLDGYYWKDQFLELNRSLFVDF